MIVKTKFGEISRSAVVSRLEEFQRIGDEAFLLKYANGRGAKSTYISYEGKLFPSKAIFRAAFLPKRLPASFQSSDTYVFARELDFELVRLDEVINSNSPSGNGGITKTSSSGPTFSSFCESLGFPLRNVRWSWSAIRKEGGQSLFTVWDNEIEQDGQSYEFWDGESDEIRTDNGAREFKRILDETLDEGLLAFGIKCTPVYPLSVPRKRQTFDQASLLALRLRREGNKILGTIVGTVSCESIRTGYTSNGSAIDDLDQSAIGNMQPGRAAYSGTFIIRDDRVRQAVIKRGNGRCEHCGELGFRRADGSRYIEAHHIISLAKQGPDTLHNVIALCPNHHREAHFGDGWEQLEAKFKAKLIDLRSK